MSRVRQAVFAGAAATLTRPPAAASQPSPAPVDPQGRHTFDVRAFGAAGDGKAKDTAAIQKAIDACNDARGGIVYFPPGEYLTGTLVLKSNVTLHLHVSATIMGSTELPDYDLFGQVSKNPASQAQPRHLLFAKNAVNIGITGQGRVDGSGRAFWRVLTRDEVEELLVQYPIGGKVAQYWWWWKERPAQMIQFEDCKNVRIEGVRIENSPFWAVHPVRCDGLVIDGVTI